ncbi:MAG: ATP-binding protein [Myxococcales bacterium]
MLQQTSSARIEGSAAPQRRVLLVDDDESVLRALQRTLRRSGWEVAVATSAEAGLEALGKAPFQVVVSDYKMPGMNGVEFLRRVKELHPNTQRIMLTGYADQHAVEEAINRSEVFRFLSKPWDDAQLQLMIASAFEQHDVLEENRRLLLLTLKQNEELARLTQSLEAKVAERTLLLTRAKSDWVRTFDVIDRPIAVMLADGTLVRANRAFAAMAQRDVATVPGLNCHALLFDAQHRCNDCPLAPGADPTKKSAELEINGRTYAFSAFATGAEGGEQFVAIFHDVTTERMLTRQMIQTEKLVAVGQLAGGVAHEINNPLGGILAFSQLMQRDEGRSPEDREALADIEHAALRCKRIVESLLKFSRRAPAGRVRFDVNRSVEDALTLFRSKLKERPRARLRTVLAESLPQVDGDPGEIEQVVLNLLVNALHALKNGEGHISVRTEARDGQLRVSVEDDGTGILPEHLPHIFEPTFTTKPPGEGTGFGLSIAWSIVESHRGRIEVESAPGTGSTFRVLLPAAGA